MISQQRKNDRLRDEVQAFVQEVRNHTRILSALIRDVGSLKKLKPYLELRRDMY